MASQAREQEDSSALPTFGLPRRRRRGRLGEELTGAFLTPVRGTNGMSSLYPFWGTLQEISAGMTNKLQTTHAAAIPAGVWVTRRLSLSSAAGHSRVSGSLAPTRGQLWLSIWSCRRRRIAERGSVRLSSTVEESISAASDAVCRSSVRPARRIDSRLRVNARRFHAALSAVGDLHEQPSNHRRRHRLVPSPLTTSGLIDNRAMQSA